MRTRILHNIFAFYWMFLRIIFLYNRLSMNICKQLINQLHSIYVSIYDYAKYLKKTIKATYNEESPCLQLIAEPS